MQPSLPSLVPFWRIPGRVAYILTSDSTTEAHVLALALQRQGHSVLMFDQSLAPATHFKDIDGIRYIYINFLSHPPMRTAGTVHGIQTALQIFKPSAVIADASSTHAQAAMTAAKGFDLPIIYRITHLPATADWEPCGDEGYLAKLADIVLSDSPETTDWLKSIGLAPERILSDVENTDMAGSTAASHVSQWLKELPSSAMQKTTASTASLIPSFLSGKLRVAAVMDEFTYHSYAPECDLLQLTPNNAIEDMEQFRPELLFIESAWRGKDDLWGSKVGHKSAELIAIVQWCRQRSIPAIFWNKEDPVHFETFLSTAKLFDCVFTTDIDCIHRYKAALGHDRVYLLPFACQPRINNPIEKYERKDAFCFAGAYYVRYPERTRDLGNFVSALPEYRPIEIYDRNFGKEDPNYQFPEEYNPYIVGNLPYEQIDKAYKGYRYAINLNSIKQSQSMFARRVFELLASNTIAVSNFSRGVRLLFGDLVITTDSGQEIVRRLQALGDETSVRRLRLAGLRKVMMDHTYADRLAYLISKTARVSAPSLLPHICVTAYINKQEQLDTLVACFNNQSYINRSLVIAMPTGFTPCNIEAGVNVSFLNAAESAKMLLSELPGQPQYVAGMVTEDYYGPNYILDLALATRYSEAIAVGKVSHYAVSNEETVVLTNDGQQYKFVTNLPARSSIVHISRVKDNNLHDWTSNLHFTQIDDANLLSADEFNYCRNGAMINADLLLPAQDIPNLYTGIPAQELIARAELSQSDKVSEDNAPTLSADKLEKYFKPPANRGYQFMVNAEAWNIESTLPDGKHDYVYASRDLRPADLGYTDIARFYLDLTPGLNVQMVMLFLDDKKQQISNIVKTANRNHEAVIPEGTEWIRLGLRLYGSGTADIKALVLGHRPLRPSEVLGQAEHLVLTNHYPSYDDLYRNGFVHTRVAAYAKQGVKVDVFRLRKDEALSYHEFHDVDVITGSQEALKKLLSGGRYRSVLVHFLDEAMWEVLKQHIEELKVVVWVHGAEIQPWYRRDYNFTSEQEREAGKAQSELRMAFWRKLLAKVPHNMKLVFVSRYFAEEVMEDLGFRLPDDAYTIIHNPIDTQLFNYQPKPAEQRKKILSIRPYASKTYANDLSVAAILELSKKPFFSELEFRMIGDGKLFDETVEPLRQFQNITIERGFLTRTEIADLHKEYGLFLCPSRMDTQGVSRDEAMASGLIPITNAVAAIPEFIDEGCALIAAPENHKEIAEKIEYIFNHPEEFNKFSESAVLRVRKQSSSKNIIKKEMQLFSRSII